MAEMSDLPLEETVEPTVLETWCNEQFSELGRKVSIRLSGDSEFAHNLAEIVGDEISDEMVEEKAADRQGAINDQATVNLAIECVRIPDIDQIEGNMQEFEIKTLHQELAQRNQELKEERIKTNILLNRVHELSTAKDRLQDTVDSMRKRIEELTVGVETDVQNNFNQFRDYIAGELNTFRGEFMKLCSADVLVDKMEPKVALMINQLMYQQEKRSSTWFEDQILPVVTEAAKIAEQVGCISSEIMGRADCEKQQKELTERLMQKKRRRRKKGGMANGLATTI